MSAGRRRVVGWALIGVALAIAGCGAAPRSSPRRADRDAVVTVARPRLARFMREVVNVPFSFAVLEHDGARRAIRYRGAALVLHGAVRDLARWQAPPAVSPEGRAVFYTYARHLERQVARLELATRGHDPVETGARLDAIRQTCNGCHRFFRPPSAISVDVIGALAWPR